MRTKHVGAGIAGPLELGCWVIDHTGRRTSVQHVAIQRMRKALRRLQMTQTSGVNPSLYTNIKKTKKRPPKK